MQPGLQLSFAATLGLITIEHRFEAWHGTGIGTAKNAKNAKENAKEGKKNRPPCSFASFAFFAVQIVPSVPTRWVPPLPSGLAPA